MAPCWSSRTVRHEHASREGRCYARPMGRTRLHPATSKAASALPPTVGAKRPLRTLAIDIGGTGLKAIVLDRSGTPLTRRVRVLTPRPATPKAVIRALLSLVEPLGGFERISVGFPGVVMHGVIRTAPNLHRSWRGCDLAVRLSKETKRPTRVLNDAGVQGFGVIEGRGLEMLLTLGTGMGCALFIDGKYVPNLELAHHPFRHGNTYEEYVGASALKRIGRRTWRKRVARVVAQIEPVWNPRQIYLGGGNAKHLKTKLPPHVKLTPNVAGLLGGIALWRTDKSPDETEISAGPR
jgi:polyphosphate glucokinase